MLIGFPYSKSVTPYGPVVSYYEFLIETSDLRYRFQPKLVIPFPIWIFTYFKEAHFLQILLLIFELIAHLKAKMTMIAQLKKLTNKQMFQLLV